MLVIVLRGALDGLAAVAPVGDPDWVRLRGDKALTLDGTTPALPLDGFFALNPAMPNLHRLYKAGQADHRACGRDALSRALAFRRPGRAGKRAAPGRAPPTPAGSTARWRRSRRRARVRAARDAFAVGPVTPLVVRGPAPVLSWTPPRLPPASDDTVMRLLDLYRHTDPALARALEERVDLAAIARAGGIGHARRRRARDRRRAARRRCAPTSPMRPAPPPKFLARDDGPRIGALAFDGWDTHANEGAANGRLARPARRARRRASRRSRPAWATGVERDRRRGRHRVRPHRAHQRHRRHRSRHRHGRAARRRRAQGRPRDRRLAGRRRARTSTRAATSSRPPTCAPCSRACCGITCASTSARSTTTVFPGSAGVKPMGGLVADV